MLTKQFSTPAGVFYFKKLNTLISIRNYYTPIGGFFLDRNYDFTIFINNKNNLTLLQKIKQFFARNPYEYDPFDELTFPELEEKMSGYDPEEIMHMYYLEYWDSWETNTRYFDILDERTHFLNFAGTPILYTLHQASYMEAHYPFESYSKEAQFAYYTDDFDSIMHDPYTNEELDLPLTTLRWNYYIENFVEENSLTFSGYFSLSGKLLNDLEENNDLISSILEIMHEPRFRNTTQYTEYLNFVKIRFDLSFILFIEYNLLSATSILAVPWVLMFLVGDLLTHEFSNITVIFCDLQTVFLYIFFGQELVWKFEETFKEYVSNIWYGVKYSVYRVKYKKDSSTFKNDILKIWRLINLKNNEPKLYKKLKQYFFLSTKKKIYFSISILRATAVRDKQYFKISLFNTVSIIRFFIWCYKRLLVIIPNYYNIFKNFLINLIPNIFMFLKNFLINLIPNTSKYLKRLYLRLITDLNFLYKYIKSKM
jgi:hypothetical protein